MAALTSELKISYQLLQKSIDRYITYLLYLDYTTNIFVVKGRDTIYGKVNNNVADMNTN